MNKAAKKAKIAKVMKEFKAGTLNSSSSRGPVVKGKKQAVAIALSQAKMSNKKMGKKK
jgi:ABC-type transport system involved in Fe-S cluster assembly fused permease/ATPase subunit